MRNGSSWLTHSHNHVDNFLTPLQQTTFENSARIILILSQCFQLFSMITLSFKDIFHIFVAYIYIYIYIFSKNRSAADLLYVGGKRVEEITGM